MTIQQDLLECHSNKREDENGGSLKIKQNHKIEQTL